MMVGKKRGVESDIQFLLQKVDQAIAAAGAITQPVKDQLESESYILLFKQLDQLHKAYYFMLIDSLGLSSQIIDADGD